jgi:hypothetical protein
MADDDHGRDPTSPSDGERECEREAARRRLLEVEPGNVRDLDAAAACECSCHPRPGHPDRHRSGLCQCQWTDQERATHLAEFNRLLEEHRPEQEAWWRDQAAKLATAAAELQIEATEEVPGAPWVIVGRVDGRRFYLRERWEAYTIVISPADDPDLDPWRSDLGVLVRGGDAADLLADGRVDYGRALRVVAEAVRTHMRRETCPHSHADQDRFCRACGLPLMNRARAATSDDSDDVRDVDGFIKGLVPETLRSGRHLRNVGAARRAWQRADEALVAAVRGARAAGDSWRVIGAVLDLTEAEVRQRYDK